MHFVEFLLVGVIAIVICLLEVKLAHQKMPRPFGRPANPTTQIAFNRSTLAQRINLLPENLQMTVDEAQVWTDKSLYLKWPDDPDWYIDFGSVFLTDNDVNLVGVTPQKLGNWAEYLFQNVMRPNAADEELGSQSKPLVEGTALDGTYLSQNPGVWTKSGIIYGRPYEIKSSLSGEYTFYPDNLKAVVRYNGFFIMAYSSLIRGGLQIDYRGYTFQDIIEMGIPVGNYNPDVYTRNRAKVIAANWLIYGEEPDDPTQQRLQQITIRLRLPGDGGRLIRVDYDIPGGVNPLE